jgi:hypothetical protein
MKELQNKIIQLRNAIRYPRDQMGDERCWLDYFPLYRSLPGIKADKLTIKPVYNKVMPICTAFYNKRKAENPEPIPKNIILQKDWDVDLRNISQRDMQRRMDIIIEAGITHYKIPLFEITLNNDKALYAALPEHNRIVLDFTLPSEEEFLGKKNPCTGCPNFWKSHEHCETNEHNLHAWGPCKRKEN